MVNSIIELYIHPKNETIFKWWSQMCPPKHLHWRLHWWTLSYCPTQSVHGIQQLQRTTEQRILCFLYFSSIFNAIIYLNLWFGMSLVSYVCMLHLIYNGCATKAAPEQQLQYSVTVQTASVRPHFCSVPQLNTQSCIHAREKTHVRRLLHGWCWQLVVFLQCYIGE